VYVHTTTSLTFWERVSAHHNYTHTVRRFSELPIHGTAPHLLRTEFPPPHINRLNYQHLISINRHSKCHIYHNKSTQEEKPLRELEKSCEALERRVQWHSASGMHTPFRDVLPVGSAMSQVEPGLVELIVPASLKFTYFVFRPGFPIHHQ
jgi:hypothetical protein